MKVVIWAVFLGVLVSGCYSVLDESPHISERSLRKTANFPIGTSLRFLPFIVDQRLKALHEHHFDSYTAGNDMKMHRVMPFDNEFNFQTVDAIVAYTQQNDQRLFGHNLIWHSSTPKWVVEKARKDPQWLANFMREYIHAYVGRYKGLVHGWDVVNEGINTHGGGYRTDSIWYEILGEKYIEQAFHYAHEADPDAVLFYNDFNTERDMAKFDFMLSMVKDLQARGVPISGIGFQMHIRMDIPDEVIAETLQKAADTGLQIHLSEVDVIFNTHNDSEGGGVENFTVLTPEMRAAQREKYKNLVRMYREIVPKKQQYGITFWGFNDRDTWIKKFFAMIDWPTLYDEDLQAKPALLGVLEGLD